MKIRACVILLFCIVVHNVNAQQVDWEKFLSRNDLVFDTLTTKWADGVFTGNGLLGNMVYMYDSNTVRMEIGRTDVVDHRNEGNLGHLYNKARLPIGYFTLKPVGKILKNTARLNLWNAEVTGVITTDKGKIWWTSFSLTKENVIVFQTKTEGGEGNFSWEWNPEKSISPRMSFSPVKDFPANPPAQSGKEAGVEYSSQPMLAGGDYVTAWKTMANANTKTAYITVAYDTTQSSLTKAVKCIDGVTQKKLQNIIAVHRQWWHQYYQKSFLSLPNNEAESFYWIQLYKVASATRENTRPIDLMGPWPAPTGWPAYWNNLNIQLTYSPLFKANHLEMVEPFVKSIDANYQNLINNAPAEYRHNAAAIARSSALDMIASVKVYPQLDTTASPSQLELGNLTWMLYYYWQYYTYSKNEIALQHLIPILKRSVNYYIDVMHKEQDGKWHLPPTYSPEYPRGTSSDCNYDLSLFRWGCETLLNLVPNDSLANTWKDVLQNLTPYPADSTGFRIGRDVAFTQSHRHYSHLLMIYPLHLEGWENTGSHELIERSFYHWRSLKSAFAGFSFTGSASIYALMGKGDSAWHALDQLLTGFTKPNTFYMEGAPVIETPLAAAASLQEMLLQDHNGKLRLFPAVPDAWRDISFANMRSEGAFLLSAVRKNGATKWIKIESLSGGKCTIVTDLQGHVLTKSNKPVTLVNKEAQTYELNLQKGQSVTLYSNEDDLNIPIAPVAANDQQQNWWGTKTISTKRVK